MSKFQQKAEAQTKQIIGQMLGDELLVEEGKRSSEKRQNRDAVTMTRAAMTKASSATNADRSSRGTGSAPSG